jgi:aromatic ring-opening dioxygenase catalytic subunit (LigB family)
MIYRPRRPAASFLLHPARRALLISGTHMRLPTLYLPHGGGPCFFMDWTMGPPDTWERMAAWLRGIDASLPERPRALLVVSAHWEAPVPTVTTSAAPPLLYDYYGFPPHTYELKWPAPGAPELASRVRHLLSGAGLESGEDGQRGFDHGVFVPLKLSYPEAQVPTVQLSLRAGLDPTEHLAIGRALAPLRDEGVFLVGSGMSYHNMRGFNGAASHAPSVRFDAWLAGVAEDEPAKRDAALAAWTKGPSARECHPREEHLLPLMVAAGAAGSDRGKAVFHDEVMGVAVSALQFG